MKAFINQSLAQAQKARLLCPPNPAVGAVLVGTDGTVLGQGHTQAAQDESQRGPGDDRAIAELRLCKMM